VYCAASDRGAQRHRDEAARFGRGLAEAGATLIFGGGHVGLMGVCADAALAAGGEAEGIIPEALQERELAHPGVTRLTVTPDMQTRKQLLFGKADAICVLPGGIGTLDELCEVLTWRQLGFHDKPVVLMSVDAYWSPLLALLDHMTAEGYLPNRSRVEMTVVDDADGALAALGLSPA